MNLRVCLWPVSFKKMSMKEYIFVEFERFVDETEFLNPVNTDVHLPIEVCAQFIFPSHAFLTFV